MEFRSVLYVPGMGPLNNEDVMNPKTKNIRLYVKRVFISDDFDGELVSLLSGMISLEIALFCGLMSFMLETCI